MITKLDGALYAYTMDGWNAFETKLRQAMGKHMNKIRRFIIGSAQASTMDKQGRIQIPKELRDYAGIMPKGEVTLIGLVERFEIWQSDKLKEEQRAIEALLKTDEARDELMELGL